jgi:hypothetical protein
VVYEGKRNVDKIGIFATWLIQEEMQSIKQKAKEIRYFDLYDKYDGPVTDLPSVITTVVLGGNRKKVTARYNVPSELKGFQNFIDKLFEEKSWQLLGSGEEK